MTKTHNTPVPIPSRTTLSREALQELGRGILAGIDQNTRIRAESPPEALLGALLRLAAHTQAEPQIEVLARERVTLPAEPTAVVEVDLLLRHRYTGATAAVEAEGWMWHRRSPEEHDREIERDRRLRRYYPCLRYAAAEILRDPWGVLLEIYDHVASWDGFADVRLSTGLRAVAEACAAAADPDQPAPTTSEDDQAIPLSSAEVLRQIGAALPPPPPSSDPALQRIRQVYPRMYAPWEPEEAAALRDAFLARLDVEDMALALGRTDAAVWAQLRRMQLVAQ